MGFIDVRKVWSMSNGYAIYEIKLNENNSRFKNGEFHLRRNFPCFTAEVTALTTLKKVGV